MNISNYFAIFSGCLVGYLGVKTGELIWTTFIERKLEE